MRRVLITADAVGGVWQYATDLARGLRAHDVDAIVALLGPAPAERPGDIAVVDTGLPLDWLCDGPDPVVLAGTRVAELAGDLGADVVQLNMPTLAAVARPRVPTVGVTHGCVATWWEAARAGRPLDPAYAWHRALTAAGLRNVDRVVAPSASYAATIARHYRLAQAPDVVRNGRLPLAAPASTPLHDAALTVGRLWDGVKGATVLDAAAAQLSIPFHAAGAMTGPHGEGVTLAHLHPLGELASAELGRRLAERPVFVSAASFEPFGLAVLEAAGAGCALVLSDIATFRELWDGVAVFVPHDDPHAYAAAIDALIGDADRRLALGEAARRRASRYTPAATAAAMAGLYAQLLAATARAAA